MTASEVRSGGALPSGGRAAGLLARNADALARSADRPLLRQMADGTVSTATYATYLAIEQSFVRVAARLLGFCVWQEPDWDAAVVHARSLAGLVGEQTDYFAARVTPGGALPPGADALERVTADAVHRGGYPAVVACLCAAETLYSRWCTDALAANAGELRGPAADWILLHTTAAFTAQASFLQDRVDRIDPAALPDAELDGWFVRMLAAEDAFHDAALTADVARTQDAARSTDAARTVDAARTEGGSDA